MRRGSDPFVRFFGGVGFEERISIGFGKAVCFLFLVNVFDWIIFCFRS